jgi:hypothetical protein
MATRIIRCWGRDRNPPVAYGGPIIPEALETPIKYCPLFWMMFERLRDSEDISDSAISKREKQLARG